MAYEPEPLGPVERELVRMLRSLDLTELQPGVRERCWKEFCELAGLPDSALPVSVAPPDDLPDPAADPDAPASGERHGRLLPAAAPAKFRLRTRPA